MPVKELLMKMDMCADTTIINSINNIVINCLPNKCKMQVFMIFMILNIIQWLISDG